MHDQAKVKRNINTLDNSIWCPSKNGFSFLLSSRPDFNFFPLKGFVPKSQDIDILNRLLYLAQSKRNPDLKFFSVTSMLKELGYEKSSSNTVSVISAVEKWQNVKLSFKSNVMYIIDFYIFDNPVVSGRRRYVQIRINKGFYQFNNDKYSVYLPIKAMEALKPYSKRLYEILVKSFYKRKHFNIGIEKLVTKMAYPHYDIQPHYEFNRIVRNGVKDMKHLLNVKVSRKGEVFYFEVM
jgi:hypothetical protein